MEGMGEVAWLREVLVDLKSLNLNLKVFSQKLDFSAFLEVHLILIFIELIISGGEVRLVTGEPPCISAHHLSHPGVN